MRNKYIRFTLLAVLSFGCLCSCSCSHTHDEKIIEKESNSSRFDIKKYYKNNLYIVGRRVFDEHYYTSCTSIWNSESFTLEEFPDLEFVKDHGMFSVFLDDTTTLRFRESLYVADVNQDGHFDLCSVGSSGSGYISYYVQVYDLYNHEYIFEKHDRNVKDYYFDIDENNVLCLVGAHPNGGLVRKINQVGRFLKGFDEPTFSWYTYDWKVTDISFGNYSDFSTVVNNPLTKRLYIDCYLKYGNEFPFDSRDLVVERVSGPIFTYEAEDNEGNPSFDLTLTFLATGDATIRININGFTQELKGVVTE